MSLADYHRFDHNLKILNIGLMEEKSFDNVPAASVKVFSKFLVSDAQLELSGILSSWNPSWVLNLKMS